MRRQLHEGSLPAGSRRFQAGFSLIELMVVLVIFLIVSGAVFSLLSVAQIRYRSEQRFLESLQAARTGVDQLLRDIHAGGYPPRNGYDATAVITMDGTLTYPTDRRVAVPLVGVNNVGIIAPTCQINTGNPLLSTCAIPNAFELVIEADLDPDNTNVPEQVEWIYYRVETPGNPPPAAPAGGPPSRTLYRMVSDKVPGGSPVNPAVATYRGIRVSPAPFVENVLNDPAAYVGGANDPQAVFRYVCRDVNADGVADATCTPANIDEVYVVLQVRSPQTEVVQQQGQIRALTLQGVARVLNPAQ